ASVVLKEIQDAGGFYVRTPVAAIATPEAVSAHLWSKLSNELQVFGADFFGVGFGHGGVVALVHLVGVLLVVWAGAAVLRRLFVEDDQIVQMLAVAFLVVLVAYIFAANRPSNDVVGLLPIGAVLAGRVLGGKVTKAGLVPALAVVFVALAVFLGANA